MEHSDKIVQSKKKQEILRLSNEESNRVTKECLQTALIYLMDEKPFERITITELVKRAGVSRTAFYRNYISKEALLGEICNSITNCLQESLQSSLYAERPREWYAQWFQLIKDNAVLVRLLVKANLFEDSMTRNESFLEKTFSANNLEQHYTFVAMEGALLCIVMHWFTGGMQESVSLMAEICTKLHYHILQEMRPISRKN